MFFEFLWDKKKYSIIFSFICVIIGAMLYYIGNDFLYTPCSIVSVSLLICGATILINGIISAFQNGFFVYNYISCLLYIIPGVILLYNSFLIKFAVIAILGMCGLLKLNDGIIMLINRSYIGILSVIAGLTSIVAALTLLMIKPLLSDVMHYVLGAMLVASGVTDLISGILFAVSGVSYFKNNSEYIFNDD